MITLIDRPAIFIVPFPVHAPGPIDGDAVDDLCTVLEARLLFMEEAARALAEGQREG
jgi:hypothetical protein